MCHANDNEATNVAKTSVSFTYLSSESDSVIVWPANDNEATNVAKTSVSFTYLSSENEKNQLSEL